MKSKFFPLTEFLFLSIDFYCPIDREEYDLGSIELSLDGRNYKLDVVSSTMNHNNSEITCMLEEDMDVFPIDERTNYLLTDNDLCNSNLKATVFIGGDYEIEPEFITLSFKQGGCTRVIDVDIE